MVGVAPKTLIVWSFWIVKVPWLLKTAPSPNDRLFVPLQVALAPAGSLSVRVSSVSVLELPVQDIPPSATVVPVPLIVPPVQVNRPPMVSVPGPVNVPADRVKALLLSVEALASDRTPAE